ncbi:hypothetical protein C0416_05360 [bacterium]|nr:hypothetical protein [bacterium]
MIKKLKKIGTFVKVMLVTAVVLASFAGIAQAQVNESSESAGTNVEATAEKVGGVSDSAESPDAPSGTTTTPTSTGPDNLEGSIYVPLDTSAYGEFPQLSSSTPTGMLDEFVYGIIGNLKYMLGAVAIFFLVLSGIKMIILGDNEEVVTKQKVAFVMALVGLALVMLSDELAKVMSVACVPGEVDCARGGFLKDPGNMIQQAGLFKQTTRVLITFIKYLIGSVALIFLVRNGIRFIALAGNEESVGLDKKNVAFTSLGLILIIMASTVIDKVLYIVDITKYSVSTGVESAISPSRGVEELVGITNFIVSFVAPVAILMLIVGAVMYATAAGNEEQTNKAKKLIILAVGGMAIIYGAFAIISTVVSGQFIP